MPNTGGWFVVIEDGRTALEHWEEAAANKRREANAAMRLAKLWERHVALLREASGE